MADRGAAVEADGGDACLFAGLEKIHAELVACGDGHDADRPRAAVVVAGSVVGFEPLHQRVQLPPAPTRAALRHPAT